MQTNNKLREAMMHIQDLAEIHIQDLAEAIDADDPNVIAILDTCRDALAEPIRNCEVGTANEQAERFENFCLEHIGCVEETGGRHCVGCPLEKASRHITQKCELYWAQLPYEAEEGGAK